MMSKKLHVGNLSFLIDETSLRDAFQQDGRKVSTVSIVMDKARGRSRGFAFVEMENDADAEAAIKALHGSQLDGRELRVSEADGPKSRFGGTVGGAPGRVPTR